MMPTPNVGVSIMAVPQRKAFVADLVARLDVAPAVVFDRWGSRWDTGRRALLAYDPAASHHAVLQDDSVVCRQLIAGCHRIIRHVPPGHPIGLYYGARRPHAGRVGDLYRHAKADGRRWIAFEQSPMWGVGLLLPTGQIAEMVAWCDRLQTPSYDGRVRHWYRKQKLAVWHPIPSLVDHRNGPDNPSTTHGRHSDGRVAHEFIGADASPLDVDWDTPPVYG